MTTPATLFDRIWESHVVAKEEGVPSVLYIDLHLVHEVTSPQAFAGLKARGLRVRRPDRTVATMDHSTPTIALHSPDGSGRRGLDMVPDETARHQLRVLEANCHEQGIKLHVFGSPSQGIVHVIGPELGLTQPGMTVVCGDSHTSTHGAFGALAFGIGTTEVEHVLATQCLLQHKPRAMRVTVQGALRRGVGAKDLILALIAQIGVGGANGHVVEYTGDAVQRLDMEGRMTVCNMSIEAGARAGMIAPDDTTFQYLASREYAPKGARWDEAVARWRALRTDDDARFDREVTLDASEIEPMVTWGTNPAMAVGVSSLVPSPDQARDAQERSAYQRALEYMDLEAGKPLAGKKIDAVFVGSCTNGRISDLRAVARVLEGRRVADGVRMLIVPGSQRVKGQAEEEGARPHLPRSRGRVARVRVFDVHRDERRPAPPRGVFGEHEQSQLRGTSGKGGAHVPRFSAHRRRLGGGRVCGGSPRASLQLGPRRAGRGGWGGAMNSRAPFTRLSARTAVVNRDDVDTDQIIPARFLKTTDKSNLASALFADWRYADGGAPRPEFPLYVADAAGAEILVGGRNFGCGSSREHAVWAIAAGGFRAVIAPSFADIFRNNAAKNGLLAVAVEPEIHAAIVAARATNPALVVTVDLETQSVRLPDGATGSFPIDPFAKRCLLQGLDELGYLLSHRERIEAYELRSP